LLAALQWLGEGSSVPSNGVKLVGSRDHHCFNPWPLLNKRNPSTEVSVMLHSSHLYGIAEFLYGWGAGGAERIQGKLQVWVNIILQDIELHIND